MMLGLLGVDPELIVADYACSVLDPKIVTSHINRLGWQTKGLPSAHLRRRCRLDARLLNQFAAAHGRIDDWLAGGGLEPEHIARLRGELLQPA
jgi:hypothetical protein